MTDAAPLRAIDGTLRRSEAIAHAIIESASEGILLADEVGRIESLNRASELMFGVQREAMVGAHVRDLLSDEHYALLKTDFLQFLRSGASKLKLFDVGRELVGRRADGTEFPIHLTIRELQFDGERRFAALIRDISEQKANEVEIRRQNERLKATIEFSPIGISMIDSDLRILAVNPAFANMIGYEVSEIVGHKFAEFTHPDDIGDTEQAAQRSFAHGPDHYSIRKRYIHKDGHIVHAALVPAIVRDSEGNPEFAITNIEDLTSRLTAESQLKEQQDQLNRLDRLSMLGEMTAGIAHEINQPLTAISTYAQSALRFMNPDNPKPDRMKEALGRLSDEARRAGAVVERIRDLARQRQSENRLVECSGLIESLEELANTDARSHGIVIRTKLSCGLPRVMCDPIQIQQVVLNLIRNAVDSTKDGDCVNGNEIVVSTGRTEAGDVRIAVIDSGPGVSDTIAKDLFRPFSTNKASGMGLGLSISRSIVTAHGGQLDYVNNASSGATFFFTLPPAPKEIHDD